MSAGYEPLKFETDSLQDILLIVECFGNKVDKNSPKFNEKKKKCFDMYINRLHEYKIEFFNWFDNITPDQLEVSESYPDLDLVEERVIAIMKTKGMKIPIKETGIRTREYNLNTDRSKYFDNFLHDPESRNVFEEMLEDNNVGSSKDEYYVNDNNEKIPYVVPNNAMQFLSGNITYIFECVFKNVKWRNMYQRDINRMMQEINDSYNREGNIDIRKIRKVASYMENIKCLRFVPEYHDYPVESYHNIKYYPERIFNKRTGKYEFPTLNPILWTENVIKGKKERIKLEDKYIYPLLNHNGEFTYDSYLLAYSNGIIIEGIPSVYSEADGLEMYPVEFEGHAKTHTRIMEKEVIPDIEKLSNVYQEIQQSCNDNTDMCDLIVCVYWFMLHESGVSPVRKTIDEAYSKLTKSDVYFEMGNFLPEFVYNRGVKEEFLEYVVGDLHFIDKYDINMKYLGFALYCIYGLPSLNRYDKRIYPIGKIMEFFEFDKAESNI